MSNVQLHLQLVMFEQWAEKTPQILCKKFKI